MTNSNRMNVRDMEKHSPVRFCLFNIEIILAVILVTCIGCTKDKNPFTPDPSPVISDAKTPDRLTIGANQNETISVKASDPQGLSDINVVTYTILDPDAKVALVDTLLDDGNISNESGDLIPKDGIYSKLITPYFTGKMAGDFSFVFQAEDKSEHTSNTITKIVRVESKNEPPKLYNLVMPDSLKSGFERVTISISVSDSQGLDDIAEVYFTVHTASMTSLFDRHLKDPESDGTYSLAIDSTFAEGLMGDYVFVFTAVDSSESKSEPLSRKVCIENESPIVFNADAPERMNRPVQGTIEFILTVDVTDPQGFGDVREAFFNGTKPDGNPSSGNPFYMYNDGDPEHGDEDAGDNTFSLKVEIDPTAMLGSYEFAFQAKDWVGNTSEPLTVIIVVE